MNLRLFSRSAAEPGAAAVGALPLVRRAGHAPLPGPATSFETYVAYHARLVDELLEMVPPSR